MSTTENIYPKLRMGNSRKHRTQQQTGNFESARRCAEVWERWPRRAQQGDGRKSLCWKRPNPTWQLPAFFCRGWRISVRCVFTNTLHFFQKTIFNWLSSTRGTRTKPGEPPLFLCCVKLRSFCYVQRRKVLFLQINESHKRRVKLELTITRFTVSVLFSKKEK